MRFADAFREAPLAAILRGISPVDVLATCDALHRAGVRVVEVPLNSPDALESVRLVAGTFANMLVCGAGTVLQAADVDRVKAAGGEIIVSPNTNRQVIHRARALDLIAMPGFVTATEAFEAYDAGARYLKLFPASTFGTAYLKQLLAVLPPDAAIVPVGGVAASDIASWWKNGARGFGIGSEIYRPGQPPDTTYARASELMAALRAALDGK
jgi:2-dehydro-3-deoxyphosphogalactonate aldolase